VDFSQTGNYNFEEFRRYTSMHTQAKKIDDAKSERFYKMAKYVKANIDKPTDPHVHKFTQIDNLRHDLIEVPEEF
jgi:hypothetical protein